MHEVNFQILNHLNSECTNEKQKSDSLNKLKCFEGLLNLVNLIFVPANISMEGISGLFLLSKLLKTSLATKYTHPLVRGTGNHFDRKSTLQAWLSMPAITINSVLCVLINFCLVSWLSYWDVPAKDKLCDM